jgi:glutathione synthase/RimK-type ligase-like ATP-grasp enzyme
MQVLILTQGNYDPHVKCVSDAIKILGGSVVLFERYRRDHLINFCFDKDEISLQFDLEGKIYDTTDFASVWAREKPILKSEYPVGCGSETEQFVINEWKQAIRSFYSCSNIFWVNNPIACVKIIPKPYQLTLAKQCGLNISDTLVTNNIRKLKDFTGNHRKIIYKTLYAMQTYSSATFSHVIDINDLTKNPDSVTIAPGIFQQYVEKEYELRITVVGDQLFVAKVDSQPYENSRIDWRLGDYEKMFFHGTLSNETTRNLLCFHRAAELTFAAYDFIVTPEGKEVFLECNPSGQWLWLEKLKNMNISHSLAEVLLHRRNIYPIK